MRASEVDLFEVAGVLAAAFVRIRDGHSRSVPGNLVAMKMKIGQGKRRTESAISIQRRRTSPFP
jgi:hypothetical protein